MNFSRLIKENAAEIILSVCGTIVFLLFLTGNLVEGFFAAILWCGIFLLVELIATIQYLIHKLKGQPMSLNKQFAQLRPESPFYEVFTKGLAPIKCSSGVVGPTMAKLDGFRDPEEVYMLDIARCTTEQIKKIAETISKHHKTSIAEVMDFINREKTMPIRASQVSFVTGDSIDLRMFI